MTLSEKVLCATLESSGHKYDKWYKDRETIHYVVFTKEFSEKDSNAVETLLIEYDWKEVTFIDGAVAGIASKL